MDGGVEGSEDVVEGSEGSEDDEEAERGSEGGRDRFSMAFGPTGFLILLLILLLSDICG